MKTQPYNKSDATYTGQFATPTTSQTAQSQQSARVQFLMNQIRMTLDNNSLDDAQIARKIFLSLQPGDEIPENIRSVFENNLTSDAIVLFRGLQGLNIKKGIAPRTLFPTDES